jgi:hypothetical protein
MAQNIFGGQAESQGAAIGDLGAGVSDLFAGFADNSKMAGDYAGAAAYNQAADFANQEAEFTKLSTNVQEMQQSRAITMSLGQTTADVAGAGFATSGSALDILRASAQQGAITQQVTQEQGNITEAGYKEEAQQYEDMANAAVMAGNAQNTASIGADVGAALKVGQAFAALPV